jgi:3-carboxy-cis,cis-muconate cycloisomerase
MQHLYDRIFYHERINKLYTEEATIGYMLQFESALASAQAKHGIIPDREAVIIAECCCLENINIEYLIKDAALGANTAIPLIKQLAEIVKQKDQEAAKYVHLGATSQDVIDTAAMLQIMDAFQTMVEDLHLLIQQLIAITEEHKTTMMVGRSFMQQARPITFGYKVAGWLEPILRSQKELKELLKGGFVLQLGGAVGSLSGMQQKGWLVSKTMSKMLNLHLPAKPWHTERDYFIRIATALSILTGNIGKMAKDISLLMQTEIGEVMEPAEKGKGGSSSMPHKRNPVGSIAILANASRVPGLMSTMFSCMLQDHERGAGLWHAEWETLASIVQLTAGCVSRAIEVTHCLEVRKEQMLYNLEATKGLIYAENVSFALAGKIGKGHAHEVMEQCSKEALQKNIHLKEVLLSRQDVMDYLNPSQIDCLFDPATSIGLCEELISQVLNKERGSS